MKKVLSFDLSAIKSIGFDLRQTVILSSFAYKLSAIRFDSSDATAFKLSHVYELLSSALGFKTFAALKTSIANSPTLGLSDQAQEAVENRILALKLGFAPTHANYVAHYVIEHLKLVGFTDHDHSPFYSAIQPIYQYLNFNPFNYEVRSFIDNAYLDDQTSLTPDHKLPLLAWVDASIINNMVAQYIHRANRNEHESALPLFLNFTEIVSLKFSDKNHQYVSTLLSQYNPISQPYWSHTVGSFEDTLKTYYLNFLPGSKLMLDKLSNNRMDIYSDLYDLEDLVKRSIHTCLSSSQIAHKTALNTFASDLKQLNALLADGAVIDLENYETDNETMKYGVKLVLDAIELFKKTNLNFLIIPSDFFFSNSGLLMCDFSQVDEELPHAVRFKPGIINENLTYALSYYDFSIFMNIYLTNNAYEQSYTDGNASFPAIHALMMQIMADDKLKDSRLLAVLTELI